MESNTSMVSVKSANSEHSEQDEYVKGNYPSALEFKERQMVRYLDKEGNLQPYPLSIPLNKLGKLGIGIEMYFKFLKFFSVLFFLMSLATIPAMYTNYMGNGLENVTTQGYLQKFMIANQPTIQVVYPSDSSRAFWDANPSDAASITDANTKIMQEYVRNQMVSWWYCAGGDILAALIFLIGIQIFTLLEARAI